MIELPDLEMEILRACLFPETFDTLVDECKLETKQSVIADAVKNLIHYKLLVATNTFCLGGGESDFLLEDFFKDFKDFRSFKAYGSFGFGLRWDTIFPGL